MSSEDQYLVFGSAQKRTEQEAEMITNTDDRPVVSDSFSSLSALFKHQTKVSTQYCSDISIFHSFFFSMMKSVAMRGPRAQLRLVTLSRAKLVHNLRFMQIKLNRFANMFIMLKTLLNPQLNLNIIVSISRPPKDHLNGCKNKNVDNCRYLGTA